MQTGVTGDYRWPKDHLQITLKLPGHTYPPKILCAVFPNAVSQTNVNPKGMKQHNK